MTEHSQNIQEWATEGGGEGDPASSVSEIRAYIEEKMSHLGNVVYDEDDITGTSSPRPKGTFMDYDDLYAYLEEGGLIFLDPSTNEPVPNSIITIMVRVDEAGDVEYETWIDSETP